MTPDRFFALLLTLQTRDCLTTADLADQVGVSTRTVVRDLRWLQDAGFPILIRRGRWGGVSLLPGGALDTARLTPDERDHLALAGLDDAQRDQLGGRSDGRRALDKVTPRGRARPGQLLPLSAVVVTDNRPWFSVQAGGVEPARLVGDLRRGVRLRVNYRRATESQPTWQVVDPYGLLAKGGRWYLVADKQGSPRLYSLERLADWEPLRVPRRLRAGSTAAQVAAQVTANWENTENLRVEALLSVTQVERAQRILGTRLTVHPPADGERVPVTVSCRVLEDVRQLLPFADHLIVTGPAEARAHLRDLAARTFAQYSSP